MIIIGLKILVPHLNKSKVTQILVEPGPKYTRAAFSIKIYGMLWRMTKKRTRSTHLGKNIFHCFTDWNGTKGKLNFDIF